MDALSSALKVAASGLTAQSERLRVVSENLANAQSTGQTPGSDPYRRKTISFAAQIDRASGAATVEVANFGHDGSTFPIEYQPGNEAANDAGYVKMPNVNVLIEMADMREANRSYEANLQVIKQARELISMTIDLLKSSAIIPLIAPLGTKLVEGLGQGLGNLLGNSVQPTGGVGSTFASLVGDAAGHIADNLQQAEQLSVKALEGNGDMRSVVDAVMSAEQSLQAAVAIRDKIVSAYLEVSRMQI